MNKLTIGYLSWKKIDIFKKTLKSHKQNGLFNLIPKENRIIFFQEIDENQINLAKEYECNYTGDINNIGILNAFIKLVEQCKTEYFIFCENDFILLPNFEYSIEKSLEDIQNILNENYFAQVKLSNYKNPGFLYCTPSNKLQWLSNNNDNYPYKIESLSWIGKPEEYYKNINLQIINKNYKWYQVNFNHQRWSNHIYACNTKFLKQVILPLLIYNRETNTNLDIQYQGLEETLCFPDKYFGNNYEIDLIINKLKELKIISGGGNFFHNKV